MLVRAWIQASVASVLLWASATPANAACSISTTAVAFGAYSTTNASPTETSGSVQIDCTIALVVTVTLSTGASGSFAARQMASGSERLDYNLYTNAGRTTIWGDGSSGTGFGTGLVVLIGGLNFSLYGRIPALQNVAVGSYSDTVIATVNF